MSRIARIVVPEVPHHVTQRGNAYPGSISTETRTKRNARHLKLVYSIFRNEHQIEFSFSLALVRIVLCDQRVMTLCCDFDVDV
jgi:hypothetical protein